MNCYVLIRVSSGVVSNVKWFNDLSKAKYELGKLQETMDSSNESASIFSSNGMELSTSNNTDEIYLIGNPKHSLGFLVVGHHEPVGYRNPVEALYYLEKKRREMGNHINLYKATQVKELAVKKDRMEEYVKQKGDKNIRYKLISEFVEG